MSVKKKVKGGKRTASVVCRDRKQFWQWVREGIVVKTGKQPLTGCFQREHEELLVIMGNTVLNLAHPNHLRETLTARRIELKFTNRSLLQGES
ncbi:MAG: hypothetical protein NVSMB56_16430 [Pyrinomonadaceae bacterium]